MQPRKVYYCDIATCYWKPEDLRTSRTITRMEQITFTNGIIYKVSQDISFRGNLFSRISPQNRQHFARIKFRAN